MNKQDDKQEDWHHPKQGGGNTTSFVYRGWLNKKWKLKWLIDNGVIIAALKKYSNL